jgi:hypothetical protein
VGQPVPVTGGPLSEAFYNEIDEINCSLSLRITVKKFLGCERQLTCEILNQLHQKRLRTAKLSAGVHNPIAQRIMHYMA